MAGAKAISEEAVSVVGVADARKDAQVQHTQEPEIRVGVWEDIADVKRRIKAVISKLLGIVLHTPGSSIMEGGIRKTGVFNEKFAQSATVQMHNSMCREAFMKVQKEDRIVFIPHCLRDAKNCVAPIDENGYHCRKCGRCVIKNITEECEKRGMKWYMCGGGSQVINIIQKIKPKAVIGIACHNEIQMALEKLKTYDTPIQAVMLRKSGCVNTELDMADLIEVLDL